MLQFESEAHPKHTLRSTHFPERQQYVQSESAEHSEQPFMVHFPAIQHSFGGPQSSSESQSSPSQVSLQRSSAAKYKPFFFCNNTPPNDIQSCLYILPDTMVTKVPQRTYHPDSIPCDQLHNRRCCYNLGHDIFQRIQFDLKENSSYNKRIQW